MPLRTMYGVFFRAERVRVERQRRRDVHRRHGDVQLVGALHRHVMDVRKLRGRDFYCSAQ